MPTLSLPEKTRKLLTHPSGMSVELLDWMGGDIDIVNAARVSYGKESQYEWGRIDPVTNEFRTYDPSEMGHGKVIGTQQRLDKRDAGLLNYLLRERHGTPFEMVQLKYRVKAPIGVAREWFRHRIGSFNETSTRYVTFEKDYYVPEDGDWREQVGKVGHYEFSHLDDDDVRALYVQSLETAFETYNTLVERGLAREVARNVLPLATFTQFIWSVNLRSLFNFLSLRTAPNALREIQVCARMVESLTETVVPEALQVWKLHGRQAP